MVRVWTASVADAPDPGGRQAFDPWLTGAERTRCDRFLQPHDQLAYAAAHALLRWALATHGGVPWAQQRIVTDVHGRPALATGAQASATDGVGMHFSLSHARGLVAVALAPGPRVGVDVENVAARRTDVASLADAALAPPERAWVDAAADDTVRRDRFFRLWTLKEALLKAVGLGLALPLRSIALQAEPPTLLVGPPPMQPASGWQLAQWQPAAGCWAALALDRGGGPPVEVQRAHLDRDALETLLGTGPTDHLSGSA